MATDRSPGAAARAVTLAAALAAVGGVLFGYDTGVISGVLPNISTTFHFDSPFTKGLVVAVLLAGAAVGALAAGRIADSIGRRRTVFLTGICFVVGLVLSVVAPTLWFLLIARVIIGLGVGAASTGVPVYISELAPPERRGGLVSFNQLCITLGILSSEIIAYFLAQHGDWRISVGIALVPAIALIIGATTQPESPAWLIRKGRVDEAREVLNKLRGPEHDIEAEIADVRSVAQEQSKGRLADLLDARLRPALMVGVMLAVIQQFTGINTVVYFAPTLLKNAGLGTSSSLLANVVVGAINVIMTIVSIKLLDRIGRRPLLLGGTAGMVVGLAALIVLFRHGHITGTGPAIEATIALAFYVGSFAIGLGPVFWLVTGEIFPLRVRGQAASVATAFNWIANLIVAVSFLSLLNSRLGPSGTFGILAGVSVLSLIYMALKVPETKGRSLTEIEGDLRPTAGEYAETRTPRPQARAAV